MSAVLCLPACLCVSAAASRGQAPPRERFSTSTIQSSNLEFQQVDDDEDNEQQLGQRALFK